VAQHKSSKKRIKSDAKKNARNRSYISSVRTAVKKLRVAMEKGEKPETVSSLFANAQTLLARAATKGILHKNNAARRISRLSVAVKATTKK